jgi:hypothetical protein
MKARTVKAQEIIARHHWRGAIWPRTRLIKIAMRYGPPLRGKSTFNVEVVAGMPGSQG